MDEIPSFYVMQLLARAKALEEEGRSIIHMEVGEPDFPTPDAVIEAGHRALDGGHTRYLPATGLPRLKEQIAGFYDARFGVTLDPEQVVITPGSSGALQLLMGVLVNPGEQVLMADPGYPCNRNFVVHIGGEPVSLPVGPETDYQLTAEQLSSAWTPNTRAVMVATPSNPTGTLLSRRQLTAIHEVVRENGGTLIVDEIYQGLIYGEWGFSALELADDIFVINSFSKYFGMTGWRVGWLVAPISYVDAIDRLAQNIFISSSSVAQYAGLAAFLPETLQVLEARRAAFQARRDFLLPAIRELGFTVAVEPRGAFYLYADCSAVTDDSYSFCMNLLEQQGVAATPGLDFGHNLPERHIRFAYTTEIPKLEQGIARLERFLG